MFMGYADPNKGIFSAPTTELQGKSFKNAVMIWTSGKAGTGGPRGLDYCVRAGNAPAAMVNLEIDPILVAAFAMENIPMVQIFDENIFTKVKNGDKVIVDADNEEVVVKIK